ncbi:MAG: hypothetical protein EA352_02825, partial [Gemmatimonadales bacterium]
MGEGGGAGEDGRVGEDGRAEGDGGRAAGDGGPGGGGDVFGLGLRGLLEPHGGSADDPEPHPDGWLASVAVVLRPPPGADGAATPNRDPAVRIRRTELLLIRRATSDRDPWSGH